MAAITAFIDDLVSTFSPPSKDPYVTTFDSSWVGFPHQYSSSPPRRRKRPTVTPENQNATNMMCAYILSLQNIPRSKTLASIDDLAFKRVPQVGSAPDMINDDLPTNPDYLDESFGAAAGLRELTDEDLDDFDDNYFGPASSTEESQRPGIVSKFGGETIRMLRPEGLRVVEHYFDTLPPESTDDSARCVNSGPVNHGPYYS